MPPTKPKNFICDATFIIAIIKYLDAQEIFEKCAELGFSFFVSPAVVRESLKNGADGILSLLKKDLLMEKGMPPLSKEYLYAIKHLSTDFHHGEVETMLIAKHILDKGDKIIPIIDEDAAHEYWKNYIGKGKSVYRTGRFILEACKRWKVIDDRGKAATYIGKLPFLGKPEKEMLIGQLGFNNGEIRKFIKV